MNFYQIIKLLVVRWKMHNRNKWSRSKLEEHQTKALKDLHKYAYANSPFYKEFHRGFMNKPLNELPVLTKKEVMENWDTLVTDKQVKLEEVKNFLFNLPENQVGRLFKNKYYAVSTAGSTGLKGIFINNEEEWFTVLVSYTRANDWALIESRTNKSS